MAQFKFFGAAEVQIRYMVYDFVPQKFLAIDHISKLGIPLGPQAYRPYSLFDHIYEELNHLLCTMHVAISDSKPATHVTDEKCRFIRN